MAARWVGAVATAAETVGRGAASTSAAASSSAAHWCPHCAYGCGAGRAAKRASRGVAQASGGVVAVTMAVMMMKMTRLTGIAAANPAATAFVEIGEASSAPTAAESWEMTAGLSRPVFLGWIEASPSGVAKETSGWGPPLKHRAQHELVEAEFQLRSVHEGRAPRGQACQSPGRWFPQRGEAM